VLSKSYIVVALRLVPQVLMMCLLYYVESCIGWYRVALLVLVRS
jgi:hypothetical protein